MLVLFSFFLFLSRLAIHLQFPNPHSGDLNCHYSKLPTPVTESVNAVSLGSDQVSPVAAARLSGLLLAELLDVLAPLPVQVAVGLVSELCHE